MPQSTHRRAGGYAKNPRCHPPRGLLKSWSIDAATSLDIALILYQLGREVLATREIAGSAGLFRLQHNYRPESAFLKGCGTSLEKMSDGLSRGPCSRPGGDAKNPRCHPPGVLLKSWSIDAATPLDIALILYLLGREVLATRDIAGSAGLFRLHPNHRPKSPILKRRGTGTRKRRR